MHSLRFHVTGSCLVELQRNKKKWDRRMGIWGEWATMSVWNFNSPSKLFVMHYQATDETKYNDNQNYH